MTPALQTKSTFWGQFFSRFLSKHLSSRIKRLIFLSSIVGMIESVESPDQEMIRKLNKILKLAHNNDALVLPMHIHSWLWKKCDLDASIEVEGQNLRMINLSDTQLGRGGFLKIAEYLMSKAPEWIVYGSEQAIAKDLELVFKNVGHLHQ